MQLCTVVGLLIGCLFVPTSAPVDETREPPFELTLIVDGKSFDMELGLSRKIGGEFKNPTVEIRAGETRRFEYGGLTFDYPRTFTWEADVEDAAYTSWTMSGNDCAIMYMIVQAEFTPESYIHSVTGDLSADKATTEPIVREFGGKKVRGTRLITMIGGIELVHDVFAIPGPKNESRLFVLQDVAPERTPESKEAKRVLDLLKRSLVVKQ